MVVFWRRFGFTLKGRKCLAKINTFLCLTTLMDEGRVVEIVYVDSSEAFAQVTHGKLI